MLTLHAAPCVVPSARFLPTQLRTEEIQGQQFRPSALKRAAPGSFPQWKGQGPHVVLEPFTHEQKMSKTTQKLLTLQGL